MNTKLNEFITHPALSRTVCSAVACLVATSMFASDTRLFRPRAEEDPPPKAPTTPQPKLPDLVPMGINAMFSHLDNGHRIYSATVSVANFGQADSADFMCLVGYKVVDTTDPAKYPVGSSHYTGCLSFSSGVKVMDIADCSGNWAFSIPEAISVAEIYIVVDRFWNWFDPADAGTWEDDAGKDVVGNIAEMDETNNIAGGKFIYYVQYVEPTTTVEVPKGVVIKP